MYVNYKEEKEMKRHFFALALMVLSFTVSAKELYSVSVGRWASYPEMFYSQVGKIEEQLRSYLEVELNCEDVRVCAYEINRSEYNKLSSTSRDTWLNGIQYNYYKMIVRASCTESYTNLSHKAFFAMDWGERTELLVSFRKTGIVTKKRFFIDPEDYPNTSGEYSYDSSSCY